MEESIFDKDIPKWVEYALIFVLSIMIGSMLYLGWIQNHWGNYWEGITWQDLDIWAIEWAMAVFTVIVICIMCWAWIKISMYTLIIIPQKLMQKFGLKVVVEFCIKGAVFLLIWKTIILFMAKRIADENMNLDFVIFNYIVIYSFIAMVAIIILGENLKNKIAVFLQTSKFLSDQQPLLKSLEKDSKGE